MSHDHNKHQHCAHAHLGHCAICQVVYCHDCAQEWTPKATWWGTTYTYTMPGTNAPTYGTTGQYPQGTVLCNEKPHTHGG